MNVFCLGYSLQGAHITNPTGATDYTWGPNSHFARMTEGMAFGRFDQSGFNNSYPAEEMVDILLMGSSHMEALQMPQDKNVGYLLNEYLHQEGASGDYIYNIGTSGHGLTDCISNLPAALASYQPRKAVIIETMTLNFTQQQIDAVLNGTRERITSHDSGLIYQLQRIPYLKLVYSQLKGSFGAGAEDVDLRPQKGTQETDALEYSSRISALLTQAADLIGDCQLIIVYHPTLALHADGSISDMTDQKRREAFSAACEAEDICFVDMTETFLRAYETEHILPHGFANTAVGVGHLNQNGHRIIAEELAKVLRELE